MVVHAVAQFRVLLHYVLCEDEVVLRTGVVQKIVVSEVYALLEEGPAGICLYFGDDFVRLASYEQCD